MKRLGIFGAGNLGKELYDIAERINKTDVKWDDIVFVDNYAASDRFYGRSIYRPEACERLEGMTEYVIATGEPSVRKEIFYQLKNAGCRLTTLIDPTACISPTAQIGEGVIIAPFSSVSCDVVIGNNVLIQSYIRVGHDISIGNHSVISANAAIGGGVTIGEEVFLGMNASVINEKHVGDRAVLAMGAALFRDLESGRTAVGNPARVTRGNDAGRVFQ